MKNYKRNFGILCIVFITILSNQVVHITTKHTMTQKCEIPKLSAGEITIVTPENTTYLSAMEGYYPATFSFDNDEINSIPADFGFWEGGGSVNVISFKDDHQSVVEIHDTSGGDYAGIHNIFSAGQTTGTIEAYVRFSNTNKHHEFSIRDGSWSDAIAFSFIDGYLYYYTGGGWVYAGDTFEAGVWLHVRIEFDCTDDWHLWINEKSIDNGNGFPFNGNPLMMDRIYLITQNTDTGYYYYIDALGYSWDANYNTGENSYEGLLLGFENTTNLEWIGYSLDNQANKTILGNTTFTIPTNGLHKIQVFGNNSLGTTYQSNVRYFSVEVFPIHINTPENITYTIPMIGYYPATYSFDNDEINSNPSDFGYWEGGGSVNVIDSYKGHKSVVKIQDTSGADYAGIHNIFSAGQAKGTIEAYVQFSNTNKHHEFSIRDGSWSDAIAFSFIDGYLYYYSGGSWIYAGDSFGANYWYHVRIEFDCTDDWHLWINEKSIDNGYGFEFNGNPTEMDRIYCITHTTDTAYSYYIDAIGYSWDVNYEIGDNINEGLLLSLKMDIDLEWIGYSLDDQANKTIPGNKTITMPKNRAHKIQIFGNNLLGTIFQSKVRYFKVSYIRNIHITKTITEGTQFNIWNENSIKSSDGIYDITTPDGNTYIITEASTITGTSGVIYTNEAGKDPSPNEIEAALSQDDGNFLYCKRTNFLPVFVPLYMRWGYYRYPNPRSALYNLQQIKIYYHVYTAKETIAPPPDWKDLTLYLQTDQGNSDSHLIIEEPENLVDYYGAWTIESGFLFNQVKNKGDFINQIELGMKIMLGTLRIHIDFLHIYYICVNEDIDFEYQFEFTDLDISPVMNVTVNINETCPGLDVSLFNYDGGYWEKIGAIMSEGIWTMTIGKDTHLYFNPKIRIRFSKYGMIRQEEPIKIDHIKFEFEIPYINLITPESKIYTESMSGYYPSTFGFENETNGDFPGGWIQNGSGSYQDKVYIVDSFEGHRKMLYLNDSGSGISLYPYQMFDRTKNNGTIEFWVYYTTHSYNTHFFIKNSSGSVLIDVFSSYNEWCYFNGTDNISTGLSSINEWFHVTIDFSGYGHYKGLLENTYKFIIHRANGSFYYESPLLNYSNVGEAAFLEIFTEDEQTIQIWVDALSYSWDVSYNIGENTKEGLLLSFESSIFLDWIGYSLDGHENVSIRGSTVIPLPDEGRHIIQISGIASGLNYQSGKVVFYIDTMIPELFINTPVQNQTFGIIPPKFNLTVIEANLISLWYSIDGGLTNFFLTDTHGYIDQDAWSGVSEGIITIRFYAVDLANNLVYKEIVVIKEIIRYIHIDLIDFYVSTESFYIIFRIYNDTGHGIWPALIRMWWNGTDVSSNISSTIDGYYHVTLDPIIILPHQNEILLNMTITADGYQDKYYECEIAIDPSTFQKGDGAKPAEFPLVLTIIISAVTSGTAVGLISLYWLKWRKRNE